ncbi:MAG TPA: LacI family DNA-binding transcriptional regulator [Bacteroidales bacterium]
MIKSKVTITDIARHLNVSVALVSLVLTDKWKENRISKELAERVNESAKQLGYKPNVVAQALRTGKSGIIGLIIADISNPFYSIIVRIIEVEAEKAGYEVMFGSSEEQLSKFIKVGETLISRQVDGLIVVPVVGSGDILSSWKARNIPIITIDRFIPDIKVPYVGNNNYQGSLAVTEFLVQKGYKEISFITNDSGLSNFKERENGFLDCLKQNTRDHISYSVFKVSYSNNWRKELRTLMKLLLKSSTRVIYFGQNMLGIEGLRICKELDISIPADIPIVSYDNPEIFEIYKPGITCYEQPITEMAKTAVSILIDIFSGDTLSWKYHNIIDGKLIVRESC